MLFGIRYVVWYGMVYDIVWHGMVYGMVWFSISLLYFQDMRYSTVHRMCIFRKPKYTTLTPSVKIRAYTLLRI